MSTHFTTHLHHFDDKEQGEGQGCSNKEESNNYEEVGTEVRSLAALLLNNLLLLPCVLLSVAVPGVTRRLGGAILRTQLSLGEERRHGELADHPTILTILTILPDH